MAAHATYWRGRLAECHVVVFGPVADPSGGWGLGIAAAHDERALEIFQDADPAIQANIGLRYETLPMLAAIY